MRKLKNLCFWNPPPYTLLYKHSYSTQGQVGAKLQRTITGSNNSGKQVYSPILLCWTIHSGGRHAHFSYSTWNRKESKGCLDMRNPYLCRRARNAFEYILGEVVDISYQNHQRHTKSLKLDQTVNCESNMTIVCSNGCLTQHSTCKDFVVSII